MKYLLLAFIPCLVFAQTSPTGDVPKLEVMEVRKINYKKKDASVSFAGQENEYVIPSDSRFLPCLSNAMKASKKVLIQMDQNKKTIQDCKLYTSGVLHMDNYQGSPSSQSKDLEAQEEKK